MQTLTVTYAKLHLVAGMTVNLNYNFASADLNFNDLALATLTDQSNQTFQGIQSVLLADVKYFNFVYRDTTSAYGKLYALLQGFHAGRHFEVDHTGDYTLMVGVADIGDKTGTSEIKLLDVSLGLRGSDYTVSAGSSTASDGLRLADGSYLSINGLQYNSDLTRAFGSGRDQSDSAAGAGRAGDRHRGL